MSNNNVVSMLDFARTRFINSERETEAVYLRGQRLAETGANGFYSKCMTVWGNKVSEKAKFKRQFNQLETIDKKVSTNSQIVPASESDS
jgi:hypothetical protein